MKRNTIDQKRKAEILAKWIDGGYPDYFARCIRAKNGCYYANCYTTAYAKRKGLRNIEEPFGSELHRETIADLAADYDMLAKDPQCAEELREVEEGL